MPSAKMAGVAGLGVGVWVWVGGWGFRVVVVVVVGGGGGGGRWVKCLVLAVYMAWYRCKLTP